jgi:hypothetical protein
MVEDGRSNGRGRWSDENTIGFDRGKQSRDIIEAKRSNHRNPCFRPRQEKQEEEATMLWRIVWRAAPASGDLLDDWIRLVSIFTFRVMCRY